MTGIPSKAWPGIIATVCLLCIFACLWWTLSHITPSYELKLAGESGENRQQMVVCESSWWGLNRRCFPIRYLDGWEIYRDGKWKSATFAGIEDAITVQDEVVGTQWPP